MRRLPPSVVLVAQKSALAAVAATLMFYIGVAHGALRLGAYKISLTGPWSAGGVEPVIFHGYPSLWLQRWIPASVGERAAVELWWTLFYVPTLLAAAVVVVYGRQHFLRLALLYAAMLFSADLIYALAPTQPPWMDHQVVRMVAERAGAFVTNDQNPIASVPSLHVGIPALWAIWFWRHEDRQAHYLGGALALWTVAMLWSVVYTGEHYLLGGLGGIAWAVVVYAALDRMGLAQAPRTTEAPAPLLVLPRRPEAQGEPAFAAAVESEAA